MSSNVSSSTARDAIPAEARVFQPDRLSVGLVLPLLRKGEIVADFGEQLALAEHADALGFRALWVRDVPLNSDAYPDPVGHLDPWVLLGALAARTRRIALVSGAVVLTLRHPLHIAKGAVSVSNLSGGRFILGLGSGDRPPEYAAFGQDTDARRDLFRMHWETVAAALDHPSRVVPDRRPEGQIDDAPDFHLLPRLPAPVPMLAVGSGGQSVDWIARHAIGWMTYHRDPDAQRDRYRMWRNAAERGAPGKFRAFGVATRLELCDRRDEPPVPMALGYRTGARALVDLLAAMRDAGTHHVAFNLTDSPRPPREVMDELARDVLPAFHVASPA
ncbi:LLM class oxidoreductase [Cupriavidus plantarum]|uniref:LLM class oxidoreductase n=1 Tax=Cupriavidus plantarum TaxID=942865 RepID=UPI000E255790|nr:LLM class oxidoreductase [Cupriavidus plantarum]REE91234.1 luciferase-type oxidoreductase [Cupriavidus plantarum]RLK31589.1 luciferase-type oxidoreductase [Cupriavidus plantarum]